MSNLVRTFGVAIVEHALLRHGDHVLAAVSGGADSVALLCALYHLADDMRLSLSVAHLNHCIRGDEADLDEASVEGLAAGFELEYYGEQVDVPAIREREGGSLEEVARRERYAFYERAAAATGAGKVALGHTRDDNAETVLQRIIRGTGLRGLGGIPPKRRLRRGSDVMIIRPLIRAGLQDVLDYLAAGKISYRTDSSNADLAYSRNRVRHVLLPQLEAECGPHVRDSLIRLAENARNQYNLIERQARMLLAKAELDEPGGLPALDRKLLAAADPELVIEALRVALEDVGVRQLSYEQSRRLLNMLSAETGTEMSLPGGLMLRAEYDRLVVVDPAERTATADEVELPAPGKANFAGLAFSVHIDDPPEIEAVLKTWNCRKEMIDLGRVRLPLTIRARRPGDRFRPLGAPGSRKLHDFFIDEKVPARQRDGIPLVCDREGIVWVAGYRIADRVRVIDDTRRAAVITMSES